MQRDHSFGAAAVSLKFLCYPVIPCVTLCYPVFPCVTLCYPMCLLVSALSPVSLCVPLCLLCLLCPLCPFVSPGSLVSLYPSVSPCVSLWPKFCFDVAADPKHHGSSKQLAHACQFPLSFSLYYPLKRSVLHVYRAIRQIYTPSL